ncbi:MAG: hypothetical protein B7W96_00815 [Parcubacteria group bacterium 37-58-5]|nr:MAG: hypothetical protein B7W96_00815 [Parcubacteria group bacterium 37-58-5]
MFFILKIIICMPSRNEDSISERQLVREAAVNPTARQQLKQELLPYVVHATKKFMQSRRIQEHRERELVEVGMMPFDRVFGIYLKNAGDRDEEEGHFFAYYIWWMRQAIAAHLQMNP